MSNSRSGKITPCCPECYAPRKSSDNRCWLCLKEYPAIDSPESSTAGKERKILGQFSLASIFLITTLIAVCLGTLRLAPGVGVLLIIVATPALIRTFVVSMQSKQSNHSLTIGEKLLAFSVSTAIIILVGIAGFIAFQIACWGSCAMVAGIQQKESDNAVMTGVVSGCVAGLGTMIWLVWKTWPRKSS